MWDFVPSLCKFLIITAVSIDDFDKVVPSSSDFVMPPYLEGHPVNGLFQACCP